jgi:hypothetical protein
LSGDSPDRTFLSSADYKILFGECRIYLYSKIPRCLFSESFMCVRTHTDGIEIVTTDRVCTVCYQTSEKCVTPKCVLLRQRVGLSLININIFRVFPGNIAIQISQTRRQTLNISCTNLAELQDVQQKEKYTLLFPGISVHSGSHTCHSCSNVRDHVTTYLMNNKLVMW